jgi:hypothetical protein
MLSCRIAPRVMRGSKLFLRICSYIPTEVSRSAPDF